MNLARDDTAAAAQILFAKNGTSVSSIQTSTNGLILQVTDGQGSVVVNDAGNANTDFRVESDSNSCAVCGCGVMERLFAILNGHMLASNASMAMVSHYEQISTDAFWSSLTRWWNLANTRSTSKQGRF